jgi:hypothetical protein
MVGPTVIDEKRPLLHLIFFAGRFQPAPLRLHELHLTVRSIELPVSVQALRADNPFSAG